MDKAVKKYFITILIFTGFFCCCLAIFGLEEELDKPQLSIGIILVHLSHLFFIALSVPSSTL
jgi:hypothetical protein